MPKPRRPGTEAARRKLGAGATFDASTMALYSSARDVGERGAAEARLVASSYEGKRDTGAGLARVRFLLGVVLILLLPLPLPTSLFCRTVFPFSPAECVLSRGLVLLELLLVCVSVSDPLEGGSCPRSRSRPRCVAGEGGLDSFRVPCDSLNLTALSMSALVVPLMVGEV